MSLVSLPRDVYLLIKTSLINKSNHLWRKIVRGDDFMPTLSPERIVNHFCCASGFLAFF